jgi:hypothetical protein
LYLTAAALCQLGHLLLCPTPPQCKLWNELQKSSEIIVSCRSSP